MTPFCHASLARFFGKFKNQAAAVRRTVSGCTPKRRCSFPQSPLYWHAPPNGRRRAQGACGISRSFAIVERAVRPFFGLVFWALSSLRKQYMPIQKNAGPRGHRRAAAACFVFLRGNRTTLCVFVIRIYQSLPPPLCLRIGKSLKDCARAQNSNREVRG